MSFDSADNIAIDRVFGDGPSHPYSWSNNLVDEALLRIEALDMSQRSLAERADLELQTVYVSEGRAAKLALPVSAVGAELHRAIGAIIMLPDESGYRALHGMSHVIDQERVAVGPPVKALDGIEISGEERRMERVTGPLLSGNAEGVLDGQKSQRTLEHASPVDAVFFLRRRSNSDAARSGAAGSVRARAGNGGRCRHALIRFDEALRARSCNSIEATEKESQHYGKHNSPSGQRCHMAELRTTWVTVVAASIECTIMDFF